MALQSIAPAEWPNNQLLRDFQRRSIFDFCNAIPQSTDIIRPPRLVRLAPLADIAPTGGAELRWNADTFAEMHRSIAVAACEE